MISAVTPVRAVATEYILIRGDAVLWRNGRPHEQRLFWVRLKASKLLRHSGVKRFLTRAGAARTATHLGGSVRLDSELRDAVPDGPVSPLYSKLHGHIS